MGQHLILAAFVRVLHKKTSSDNKPFMEYVRAEQKVFGVGIDHPDLTGDRDKQNCFDCQTGLAILIASMTKASGLMPWRALLR